MMGLRKIAVTAPMVDPPTWHLPTQRQRLPAGVTMGEGRAAALEGAAPDQVGAGGLSRADGFSGLLIRDLSRSICGIFVVPQGG